MNLGGGGWNENRKGEKKMKEGDISKGPLRAQSTHIPLYKTFHTSLDGSDHDRVHVQSSLQSGGH